MTDVQLDFARRLRVYEEPQDTHTDHSGTAGDFLELRVNSGKFDPRTKSIPLKTNEIRRGARQKEVLGPLSCSLDFTADLAGHGLDLDGDVAVPTTANWALARIWKAILGGIYTETIPSAQTVVVAGGSSTALWITNPHGSRFLRGGAVGAQTTAGYELREILSIDASDAGKDIITPKVAFSGTPTTGTPVRCCVTLYATQRPVTSLQYIVERQSGGAASLDRWNLRHMQGGLSFAFPWDDVIQWTSQQMGASWTNMGSGTLADPGALAMHEPIVMAANELLIYEAAASAQARVVCPFGAISWDLGITWEDQRGPGLTNQGIVSKVQTRTDPPISVKITEPLTDLSRFTARDARTMYALAHQFGATVGASCLFVAPEGQLIAPKTDEASGSLAGQSWTLAGREDSTLTTPLTDLDQTWFRAHFG